MKYLPLFVCIGLFIFSCNNNTDQDQSSLAISELENELSDDPSGEKAQQLVEEYQNYIASHPNDTINAPSYLYRMAEIQYRQNRMNDAKKTLEDLLLSYPNNKLSINAAEILGDIYETAFNDKDTALTIYKAIRNAAPSHEIAQKVAVKIPNNAPSFVDRVAMMQKAIVNEKGRPNFTAASNIINHCRLYAMVNPKDSINPSYLMKAVDAARAIQLYNEAINICAWITEHYPNSTEAPKGLFLTAFILQEDLNKTAEAKATYQEFIKKYPNDEFADDAKFLLENIDKDDSEIINSFQKQ